MKIYQDWKLVMPEWISNTGVRPNLTEDVIVTATYYVLPEQFYVVGTIDQIDWAITGQVGDIEAYIVGDIRGIF